MSRRASTGMTAIIIGNGSSVDMMDATFWSDARRRGAVLVGTNRALVIASLQGIELDAMVLRDQYLRLWADQDLGAKYHDEHWKTFGGWTVGNAQQRVAHCDEFIRCEGDFALTKEEDRNGESRVCGNASVVLMATNWSWIEFADRIALVGVDYKGAHATMIDPYNVDTGNRDAYEDKTAAPLCIEREFGAVAKAIRGNGGRIWNLSKRTLLKSIPRGTPDDLWR